MRWLLSREQLDSLCPRQKMLHSRGVANSLSSWGGDGVLDYASHPHWGGEALLRGRESLILGYCCSCHCYCCSSINFIMAAIAPWLGSLGDNPSAPFTPPPCACFNQVGRSTIQLTLLTPHPTKVCCLVRHCIDWHPGRLSKCRKTGHHARIWHVKTAWQVAAKPGPFPFGFPWVRKVTNNFSGEWIHRCTGNIYQEINT